MMVKLGCYKRTGRSRVTAPPPAAKGLASMPSQSTCSIDPCESPAHARGYCQKHYRRWLTHGDAAFPIGAHGNLYTRFWTKVSEAEVPGGCWEWIGARGTHGYGVISHAGKSLRAHRVSYEIHNGPVPDGLTIDHLCRNRGCVNPSHLEAVTVRENNRRGESPTAHAARQTHCKHGHEFTPENTRIRTDRPGARICRECERNRVRAYRLSRELRGLDPDVDERPANVAGWKAAASVPMREKVPA